MIINICIIWDEQWLQLPYMCRGMADQVYYIRPTACQHLEFCLFFSAWSSLSETLKVAGSINRCYPLTLENMAEGPDVRITSQPWDQLMWQWWRWVLAEETDLVASEVPVFPTFSVCWSLPPRLGNPGRQRKMEDRQRGICKHRGERETERGRQHWSVVLTVVTDVEFSTKLCQKPSCQS